MKIDDNESIAEAFARKTHGEFFSGLGYDEKRQRVGETILGVALSYIRQGYDPTSVLEQAKRSLDRHIRILEEEEK